jgi:hypothetical protein
MPVVNIPLPLSPSFLGQVPDPKGIFSMSVPGNYVTIIAVLNQHFSQGSVHINPADPVKTPTLDPGHYSHPLDLKLHARLVLLLAVTEPMASLLKKDGRCAHYDKPVVDLETAKEVA